MSILIKALKGNILKNLNYIFKLLEFKLGYKEGFAAAIINNKIAYIFIINNMDYNIIIPRHQRLGKISISIIEGYYHILIEDRYLANRPILIKKGLTVIAALLIISIL